MCVYRMCVCVCVECGAGEVVCEGGGGGGLVCVCEEHGVGECIDRHDLDDVMATQSYRIPIIVDTVTPSNSLRSIKSHISKVKLLH